MAPPRLHSAHVRPLRVFGRLQLRIKGQNHETSQEQQVRCRIGTAGQTGGVSDWAEGLVWTAQGDTPAERTQVTAWGARLLAIKAQTLEVDDD